MVISHKYKCIFIHIPRTAGTSIAYQKDIFEITDDGTHDFVINVKNRVGQDIWNRYFKFCFVRNPFDRFVSLYFYFSQMSKEHRWYNDNIPVLTEVQAYEDFEDFCVNFSKTKCRYNFHFIPQYKWITDEKGNILIDFVGKFENLNKSWESIYKDLSIEGYNALPHENLSAHRCYKDYYSNKTRRIVRRIYKKDIKMFNYTF
jgi:hypothetical protein